MQGNFTTRELITEMIYNSSRVVVVGVDDNNNRVILVV